MRTLLAGTNLHAALSATAGTAAPAPAAAPSTKSGGWLAKKTTDSPRMSRSPGRMKHNPPRRAPADLRSRQAQKIASCVEAGPGRRFVVAMASSNSLASIHSRSSTHKRRRRAMCAGGPPNPIHPKRSHSRAMVRSSTRSGWPRPSPPKPLVTEPRSRALRQRAPSACLSSTPAVAAPWPLKHMSGGPVLRPPLGTI